MEKYRELFTSKHLMGPNCVRLLGELLQKMPADMPHQGTALDLGCGKGLTSYMTAKETGYTVYANDLWISAEENRARFESWGMGGKIIPVHEDANNLHFSREMFDLLVSIDSYHYFAGKPGFFADKILPYLRSGGTALIAVPGLRQEFEGRAEELLSPWLGEEAYMFRTPEEWRQIIGSDEEIEQVTIWEMACFDSAWEDWLRLKEENPYAAGDLKHYETIIRPYTSFIGMMIRKK